MKLSQREKALIKIKSMVVIILTAAQKSVREREQGLVSTDIERTVSKATLWQLNLHLG